MLRLICYASVVRLVDYSLTANKQFGLKIASNKGNKDFKSRGLAYMVVCNLYFFAVKREQAVTQLAFAQSNPPTLTYLVACLLHLRLPKVPETSKVLLNSKIY